MKNIAIIILIVLASCFVAQTAVRIEILNAQSDYYLPRNDRMTDGTRADGKWRISQENTPRDQLRAIIETYGLLQYLLAPALLICAMIYFLSAKTRVERIVNSSAASIAAIGIVLMMYRGYWDSLGG